MKIQLQSLTLNNFKGIRKLKMNFADVSTVLGANGTGKTTLYDSFLWLLFDKDSTGRKDFEIKTLDENGNTKKDLEHSVEGTFDVDGIELILRKVYREKWTRKRGSTTDEFTGNETTYFWNDVPVKKDEFNSKIRDVFADEDTFRLVTDLKYFNSLNWQQRRQLLFSLIENVAFEPTDEELKKKLKGKTTDELKRELAASKKKLLLEIDQCPIRIDEINRSIPEEKLPSDILPVNNELEEIDAQLNSASSSNKAFNDKRSALNSAKNQVLDQISRRTHEITENVTKEGREINSKHNAVDDKIRNLRISRTSKTEEIEVLQKRIEGYEKSLGELRIEYSKVADHAFSDNLNCPTCGHEFSEDKKQSLIEKFNEGKSRRLEQINKDGLGTKELKISCEDKIKVLLTEIDKINEEGKSLMVEMQTLEAQQKEITLNLQKRIENEIATDVSINSAKHTLSTLDEKLLEESPVVDNSELIKRKNELLAIRNSIQMDINSNMLRVEKLNRIDELEQERLQYLDKLSSTERLEFELSKFVKSRIDNIEHQLSILFNGVEFKMFEEQINGGLTDTCVVQMNGVPYSDLNTASKTWVSLNIINVFSKLKNLYAPIFIDNRESVTNLPTTTQQVISLVVSPENEKLKIK